MFPLSGRLLADSKSNSSTLLPSRTTTRVSSGWLASISMRLGMKVSGRPRIRVKAPALGAGLDGFRRSRYHDERGREADARGCTRCIRGNMCAEVGYIGHLSLHRAAQLARSQAPAPGGILSGLNGLGSSAFRPTAGRRHPAALRAARMVSLY